MQNQNKTKQHPTKPNNGNLSRKQTIYNCPFVSNSWLKLKLRITELKESVIICLNSKQKEKAPEGNLFKVTEVWTKQEAGELDL